MIGIWEPLAVKEQVLKTSIEAACMLLRIDDIVSGVGKPKESHPVQNLGKEEEEDGFAQSEATEM